MLIMQNYFYKEPKKKSDKERCDGHIKDWVIECWIWFHCFERPNIVRRCTTQCRILCHFQ